MINKKTYDLTEEVLDARVKELEGLAQKYRRFIEEANDAIFSIDINTGHILEANPKAEELTGYTKEELSNMNVWEIHPSEERERAKELFKLVSSKGMGRNEMNFLKKDGSTVAVDINASVIEYNGQRVIQRICRDVSEEKKLERENRSLKEYYERILNMMPDGLNVKRVEGNEILIEFENQKLKDMFRARTGDRCYLWHRKKEKLENSSCYKCIEDGAEHNDEHISPDGRVFQFTSTQFKRPDGTPGAIEIIRDITERKKLEAEQKRLEAQLKVYAEELEKKVENRTRELVNSQGKLIQSEKMASLGHLVAGVAHEINTPVGAINSNNDIFIRTFARLKEKLIDSNLLDEVDKDGQILKWIKIIENLNKVSKDACNRIVEIIRSLKNFARLDEAERKKVNIHEGIENTLTLVHHEIKNRIKVTKAFGNVPEIECYPNQLNQVFMNMLVNASHAIQGQGEIELKTFTSDGNIIVKIRDSGVGIPQESLNKIFDPGFTTKGFGVGTGLGLSISYQIIEKHGGKIDVESELGKGTTFTITLPIEMPEIETSRH